MARLAVMIGVAVWLACAATAGAARTATPSERTQLAAATAGFSAGDELALDRRGRLVQQFAGTRRPFVLQGYWISSLTPGWARVIVATFQSDRISTVLRREGGRWRALASGGLDGPAGGARDGRQCRVGKIPRLVAIDLALGRRGAFDRARRCEGPRSSRARPLSGSETAAASASATAEPFPAQEDFGECTIDYPGHPEIPRQAFVSRSLPSWSLVRVYCTSGFSNGGTLLGEFGAIMRGGAPVARISLSDVRPTPQCTPARLLGRMPLRARLELEVCSVPDPRLLNLSR